MDYLTIMSGITVDGYQAMDKDNPIICCARYKKNLVTIKNDDYLRLEERGIMKLNYFLKTNCHFYL